jgi:hypothetical protein
MINDCAAFKSFWSRKRRASEISSSCDNIGKRLTAEMYASMLPKLPGNPSAASLFPATGTNAEDEADSEFIVSPLFPGSGRPEATNMFHAYISTLARGVLIGILNRIDRTSLIALE